MSDKFNRFSSFFLWFLFIVSSTVLSGQEKSIDFVHLSQDFLRDLEKQEPYDSYIELLATSSITSIAEDLDSDDRKYAFWINTYNSFILVHLRKNPAYYEDRRSFFKLPLITIAGEKMSFADIEHGILRRSQLGLFLGYMTNPFAGKREKLLRVENRDYRIHFALNCGAKSCPAVAIYSADKLDAELDFSGKKFLEAFSTYNTTENLVTTTALFSWFRGDFGGSQGIREILIKYGIATSADVRVNTSPYDWTLYIDNFIKLPVLH